jgi:hypothetical protein
MPIDKQIRVTFITIDRTSTTIKGIGKSFLDLTKTISNIFGKFERFRRSLARFQPQWLSVMFISQQLNSIFKQMVDPVLEIYGVFELLQATFITLLIDALEPLVEIFYQIVEWFISLPDSTKQLIGQFILFGLAITGILGAVSQVILLFSSLGIGIGTIMVLLTPFIGILGAVSFAIISMGSENKSTIDQMIANFTTFIQKGTDFAVNFIQRFTQSFEENKDSILLVANTIMITLLDGLYSILIALDPFVKSFLDTLKKFYDTNKDKVKDIIGLIIGYMISFVSIFFPDIIDLGLIILGKILEGFKQNKDKIKEGLEMIINYLKESIQEYIPMIIDLGLFIGSELVKGIAKAFWNFWTDIGSQIFQIGQVTTPGGFAYESAKAKANPYQDFIWRPGYAPVSISPKDTLIGSENNTLGTINITATYNINVADRDELEKMFKENNKNLVEEVKRQINI